MERFRLYERTGRPSEDEDFLERMEEWATVYASRKPGGHPTI